MARTALSCAFREVVEETIRWTPRAALLLPDCCPQFHIILHHYNEHCFGSTAEMAAVGVGEEAAHLKSVWLQQIPTQRPVETGQCVSFSVMHRAHETKVVAAQRTQKQMVEGRGAGRKAESAALSDAAAVEGTAWEANRRMGRETTEAADVQS